MFRTTETLHSLTVDPSQQPDKFTFPFNYEPHPWVVLASKEVQAYLETTTDLDYKFGMNCLLSFGKMFGVLIVETAPEKYGYLAGFSGKLKDANYLPGFVPPIFDVLNPDGFFKKGEQRLIQMNEQIEKLKNATELKELKLKLNTLKTTYKAQLKIRKDQYKQAKSKRDVLRQELMSSSNEKLKNEKLETLKKESIRQHFERKDFKRKSQQKIVEAEHRLNDYLQQIEKLKTDRKQTSAALQKQLHEHYNFLNANGERATLLQVFQPFQRMPPAGAGECAAPRLLHHAYQNGWKPVAMGEFWWGLSPASQIREHKHYYPACKSKCEPILTFMLQGLQVEQNPVLSLPKKQDVEIIFEDAWLMLVNKPEGILSVPGKSIKFCLEQQVIDYLPDTDDPKLVHRLDMSTSGLVLIAKCLEVYKLLQQQFMQRSVHKSYTAILEGLIENDHGEINLPLRVDLDNRPMQLVCNDYGKAAVTNYQVIDRNLADNTTRVIFYPITGRTHQLRVHAAHKLGLHAPIVGDELYGTRKDRLYLHATTLAFCHPISQERIKFTSPPPF